MSLLVLGEESNPLGHVLDRNVIGGPDALLLPNPDGIPIVTMHMLTLIAAAFLLVWVLKTAAKAIATGPDAEGNERFVTKGRIGQLVEVMMCYLKKDIVEPVLGPDTNRYLPYLMTLFFFVLLNNLLGLVPLLDLQHIAGALLAGDSHFAFFGGTATGNLAVTGGLALIAFVVIQIHGLRELGLGGWLHHLLGGAPWYLAPIMVPVETMSLFIKPAALAIRLFANMLAGHTLLAMLATFGLMAYNGLGSWIAGLSISVLAGAFAVAISFLELFVAFLQAFIFMFLTAVFIGQLSHHGDEHEHEHQSSDAEPVAAHA